LNIGVYWFDFQIYFTFKAKFLMFWFILKFVSLVYDAELEPRLLKMWVVTGGLLNDELDNIRSSQKL